MSNPIPGQAQPCSCESLIPTENLHQDNWVAQTSDDTSPDAGEEQHMAVVYCGSLTCVCPRLLFQCRKKVGFDVHTLFPKNLKLNGTNTRLVAAFLCCWIWDFTSSSCGNSRVPSIRSGPWSHSGRLVEQSAGSRRPSNQPTNQPDLRTNKTEFGNKLSPPRRKTRLCSSGVSQLELLLKQIWHCMP